MSYLAKQVSLLTLGVRPFGCRSFSTNRANLATSTLPQLKEQFKGTGVDFEEPSARVINVQFAKPEQRNAFTIENIKNMARVFNEIASDTYFRSVILSGQGKMFCAGIDLMDLVAMGSKTAEKSDISRKSMLLRTFVRDSQKLALAMTACDKPVIAAIHNACIGGAIDVISACDIRLATADSWYQIKEVQVGLAADMGTIQLLPKVVSNQSLLRELIFTGRKFDANEAKNELGLLSRILPDQNSLMQEAVKIAANIASLSPIAVQGSKVNLEFAKDHPVSSSLTFHQAWNMSMLQSEDIVRSAMAVMEKKKEAPEYDDL